jgi:hypothetical protein
MEHQKVEFPDFKPQRGTRLILQRVAIVGHKMCCLVLFFVRALLPKRRLPPTIEAC